MVSYKLFTCYINSPIGYLHIRATEAAIESVWFADELPADYTAPAQTDLPDCMVTCCQQLKDYFARKITAFNLPLNPQGTPFQQRVWQYLLQIPAGSTRTYGHIAATQFTVKTTRAVGAACGANPIGIIIPCHRVISASGSLTGYAGGLWRKKWLLNFENSFQPHNQQLEMGF
ncbi:MAG TPA: methylated-DNA--[protein]-cysteine S-methyltransferase [Chitinophagales bacterium]|nr:methylated-DNA--[protein]-cysteine S-methyltransferase [Chitinophagales bacterium]HRK28278.1 methylated-DNA--[protein]-cysteine S-methyltransferase [Chitinophagales bacterium]